MALKETVLVSSILFCFSYEPEDLRSPPDDVMRAVERVNRVISAGQQQHGCHVWLAVVVWSPWQQMATVTCGLSNQQQCRETDVSKLFSKECKDQNTSGRGSGSGCDTTDLMFHQCHDSMSWFHVCWLTATVSFGGSALIKREKRFQISAGIDRSLRDIKSDQWGSILNIIPARMTGLISGFVQYLHRIISSKVGYI